MMMTEPKHIIKYELGRGRVKIECLICNASALRFIDMADKILYDFIEQHKDCCKKDLQKHYEEMK